MSDYDLRICGMIFVALGALVAGYIIFRKLNKKPAQSVLGTERDAALFEVLLKANPGADHTFVHCGRIWRTSKIVPPAIVCPICRRSVVSTQYRRG